MKNLIVKDMSERYVDYLKTRPIEKREGKTIFYWVMSTLEAFFWGHHHIEMDVDLYASEEKMFLVFKVPTGKEYEFEHFPTCDCDGKLPIMLENFVEVFNNIEYPLSDTISSPIFHADSRGKWEHPHIRKKYNGYYHINIFVNMLPEADG